MSSRGAWCESRGCLNFVDRSGWGISQCARCRGYFCQTHLVYIPERLCLDCLEVVTQKRVAS
jgi:hypothetical protein